MIFQASVKEKQKEKTKFELIEIHSSEPKNIHSSPSISQSSTSYNIPAISRFKHHKFTSDSSRHIELKEDYETKMHKMIKRLKQDLAAMKSREPEELNPQQLELEFGMDNPPTFEPKLRYNID